MSFLKQKSVDSTNMALGDSRSPNEEQKEDHVDVSNASFLVRKRKFREIDDIIYNPERGAEQQS